MIDCIIVLAHKMSKTGELNTESLSRINFGCKLFHKHNQPYFITPGWNYRKDSNLYIGERMSQHAEKFGNIPPKKILVEINSRDTVGDAFFVKINYVERKKFKNLLVLTSNYHISRTSKIFNFIYGDKYNIEVKGVDGFKNYEKICHEKKSYDNFIETFKDISRGNTNDIYKRLKKSHPYYNGKIYPKI